MRGSKAVNDRMHKNTDKNQIAACFANTLVLKKTIEVLWSLPNSLKEFRLVNSWKTSHRYRTSRTVISFIPISKGKTKSCH